MKIYLVIEHDGYHFYNWTAFSTLRLAKNHIKKKKQAGYKDRFKVEVLELDKVIL